MTKMETITNAMNGLAMTGIWLVFDKFNSMPNNIMTMATNIAEKYLLAKHLKCKTHSNDGEVQIMNFNADGAILSIMNPILCVNTEREFPSHIRRLFRPYTLIQPNRKTIFQAYFTMVGFKAHNFLATIFDNLYTYLEVNTTLVFQTNLKLGKILPLIRRGKLNFCQSITSIPLHGDFDDIKEREIRSILNEFIKMIVSNATEDDIKTMKYFFLEIKADASSMDITDVFESVLKKLSYSIEFDDTEFTEDNNRDGVLGSLRLQPTQSLMDKISELEFLVQMNVGNVILGQTDSGKSSIAKGLFQQNDDKNVHHYRIFPGCTSFERMYGNAVQNAPKTAKSGIVF